MGNREDLLRGAKQCLAERGWSNTTVRDIATAAGVSHAAIGYHFGSRERLLVEALVEELDELDAKMATNDRSTAPADRWRILISSFATDKTLWLSHLEAIVAAQRNDELRNRLAEGQTRARVEMGGSVPLAILIGLMIQSLIDPEHAPTPTQAITEMRELSNRRARSQA